METLFLLFGGSNGSLPYYKKVLGVYNDLDILNIDRCSLVQENTYKAVWHERWEINKIVIKDKFKTIK